MNEILNRYEETKDYIDITREFKRVGDKTQVIIRINPKPGITLDEFKYIEEIAKECINALFGRNSLLYGDISGDYNEISPDPLIMWHLTDHNIKDERQLTYTINSPDFEDLCKELLSGTGWSAHVSSEGGMGQGGGGGGGMGGG